MAGLTGGVVLAVLVGFLVLGAGVASGSADSVLSDTTGLEDVPVGQPVEITCAISYKKRLTAKSDGSVVLVSAKHGDKNQKWVLHIDFSGGLPFGDGGRKAFTIVNVGTGQVLTNVNQGKRALVRLAPYDSKNVNTTMEWTMGVDIGAGFHEVKTLMDSTITLHASSTREVLHDQDVVVNTAHPFNVYGVWRFKVTTLSVTELTTDMNDA